MKEQHQMAETIGVLRERVAGERRVALTPVDARTVLNFCTATKWGMNVIPIRGIQGGHSGA
jgi:hypothetical protein